MKRNESFLVYGVTGLLVVILLVAVVFGSENTNDAGQSPTKETSAKAGDTQGSKSRSVGELLGAKLGTDLDGKLPARSATPESQPSSAPANPNGGGAVGPLSTNGAPAPERAPVSLESAFLLRSTREGDYRKVTVQDGESLSQLMELFGISQARRDEVLRLNEMLPSLDRIRSGQSLILPWVDDAVLIAAQQVRRASGRTTTSLQIPEAKPASTAPRTSEAKESGLAKAPALTVATKERKVKRGESLWKIAAECGGNVTAAIEQIRALNPGVAMDPLREGVTLKVPSR